MNTKDSSGKAYVESRIMPRGRDGSAQRVLMNKKKIHCKMFKKPAR